jgi:GT2 family glycosyltransferase
MLDQVPTYRRADDLRRCLTALARQERRPDQVVVVARGDDDVTHSLLAGARWDGFSVELVRTPGPGQVAALNAGLRAARGDVVAIVDDDTAPWPDWLKRIEAHFRDSPRLGGLGGRDMIMADGGSPVMETSYVGRISWYGRWVGQAHRGFGPPREVDLLKGCNMSFRREAIAGVWFDRRLKGAGAQWFNDAAFSLAVKRAGWQVVYDPAVRVDHFLAQRHEGDERQAQTPADVYGVVYNETLILLEHFGPRRQLAISAMARSVPGVPGLLQLRAAIVAAGPIRIPVAALRGRWIRGGNTAADERAGMARAQALADRDRAMHTLQVGKGWFPSSRAGSAGITTIRDTFPPRGGGEAGY